jgi:hypothetical protein
MYNADRFVNLQGVAKRNSNSRRAHLTKTNRGGFGFRRHSPIQEQYKQSMQKMICASLSNQVIMHLFFAFWKVGYFGT